MKSGFVVCAIGSLTATDHPWARTSYK